MGSVLYLGCTAFSDWEHRVVVVVVAEARGLDWTYLMFEGTRKGRYRQVR